MGTASTAETLLAYVGCSNLATHVQSVFTHHPPPKNLLPFLQKPCFCFHRDGHDKGMLTPQAQVASHTLVLLSCTHREFLFSSLCCIKAGTGISLTEVLQTPPNTYKPQTASRDQSQPYRTSRNKLWVLLVRKKKQYLL